MWSVRFCVVAHMKLMHDYVCLTLVLTDLRVWIPLALAHLSGEMLLLLELHTHIHTQWLRMKVSNVLYSFTSTSWINHFWYHYEMQTRKRVTQQKWPILTDFINIIEYCYTMHMRGLAWKLAYNDKGRLSVNTPLPKQIYFSNLSSLTTCVYKVNNAFYFNNRYF